MGSYTRKVSPQNIWLCCVIVKLCLALCDPMDYSPPGSSVNGILQARILEWVTIPFSGGSSWPRDWTHMFCIAGSFFTTEPPEKPQNMWHWRLQGLHMEKQEGVRSREPTLYICSQIGRINIVKMSILLQYCSILSKVIYRLNAISIK